MFRKQYGDVLIEVKSDVPKRGKCLCASQGDNRPVYMDFCGFALPDGSNAYMYGNKLIIVTRWADMSDEEIHTVNNADVRLLFVPFQFLQMGIEIGSYGWSDVFFTLHHCGVFANDEKKDVDELIMIFADKTSGDIVAERSVPLSGSIADFLRRTMVMSHEKLFLDFSCGEFIGTAENDSGRDFCDVVYDYIWQYTCQDSRRLRGADLEKIPLGVYMTADKDGRITNLYQAEG